MIHLIIIIIELIAIGIFIWHIISTRIEKFEVPYSIQEIPNFLSSEECDRVISLAKEKTFEESVLYESTSDKMDKNVRNSRQTWLYDNENEFVKSISEKVATLTNTPIENQEPSQVLNYQVGGKYDPHYDACWQGTCDRMNKNGGARYLTVLIYLNDVEEGGGTTFPNLNKTVKAEKGKAVIFQNTDSSENIIKDSLHGGNPVLQGEKWVINKWIHHRRYE